MSDSKAFFSFIAVGTAGLLLVAFSQLRPPENGNYAIMLPPQQLQVHARKDCARAARPRIGTSLELPTETLGDGSTFVQLHWRPSRGMPYAVSCRYEQGKGVTELKIDGKSYGPLRVGIGEENPSAPAFGSTEEKHWGHW